MWQVRYKKVFLRELKKLPKDVRARVEEFVFNLLPMVTDLSDVPELKKLIGYRDYYRVLPCIAPQGYISFFPLRMLTDWLRPKVGLT